MTVYLLAIESMNFFVVVFSTSFCSSDGFRTYKETFSSEGFRPSSLIKRLRSSPLTSDAVIGIVVLLLSLLSRSVAQFEIQIDGYSNAIPRS